ncbi:MAG: urease accessory protein UreD [Burkholderiales bacterium]
MKIDAHVSQPGETAAEELDRWHHAALTFAVDMQGSTYIKNQFGGYPFHFCRPFRFAGDPAGMATVYVQNCSGGVFDRDRLALRVNAGARSYVHLTTAASTIVHSMPADRAIQCVDIDVGEGALVEYMPNMLILFPQARMESNIKIRLAATGTVVLCDTFIAHDPSASGRSFDTLTCTTAIHDPAGKALAVDRYSIDADALRDSMPGITGMLPVVGNFIVATERVTAQVLLEALRKTLSEADDIYGGASLLPNKLGVAVRLLARDAIPLHYALDQLWSKARECLVGSVPAPRRK